MTDLHKGQDTDESSVEETPRHCCNGAASQYGGLRFGSFHIGGGSLFLVLMALVLITSVIVKGATG